MRTVLLLLIITALFNMTTYLLAPSTEENRQLKDTSIENKNTQIALDLSECSNSRSYQEVVSIIIATNNEESVVDGLLKSLEALSYNRELFEIIVVDDSTDSTMKILEMWANRMTNLRLIRRAQESEAKAQP